MIYFLRSVYFLIPLSIFLSFAWAPPVQILGESGRIIFFHVPVAWISVLAYIMAGAYAVIYLKERNGKKPMTEEVFNNSAGLGMAFCMLTVLSGAMWAKISWGAYWNWDPRQTSIAVLLLIYGAYFSLRSALGENPKRGRLCAVYLIFAMITLPFLFFLVPRLYPSLHPDPIINPQMKIHLGREMKIVLFFSIISYTVFYFYLLHLKNRLSRLKLSIEANGQ